MQDNETLSTSQEIFDRFKLSILNIDPVTFCENYLNLDGHPFRLRGNGFKPFVDIYRYIGIKALDRSKTSKKIVIVKGRQVGATTMAANLEMYFMGCGMFGVNDRPPMRIIHLFPQLDLATAYAKQKLNPTISQSKQIKVKGTRNEKGYMETLVAQGSGTESLYYKRFPDGNTIETQSIGIDADRIRGRTVDCAFFDEVQDMFGRAIMNATKILSQSQYGKPGTGVQVYFGTPKGKDSVYYDMWSKSTQNYYFLGCEKCGEFFPLYTPGSDDWEKIWLDDFVHKCPCGCEKQYKESVNINGNKYYYEGFQVKCTHCGHVQDKRDAAERGKWIGKDPNECEFIGFHINQLYMPNFDKKEILSKKPGASVLTDEVAWQNEVLGEFYVGENCTITAEEIKAKCADYNRQMVSRIDQEDCQFDKNVYLGGDWGKKTDNSKNGQSYSCLVVLQCEGPKILNIQFATKLQKNDIRYKLEIIDQVMSNYNVKMATGDIGYANDLMVELSQKYGDRFLATNARSEQINGKIRVNDKDFPKTIYFERDTYIDEVFDLMRNGSIRFPFGSWEMIAWLVHHCSSMIAKPQMDRFGNMKMRYAKGAIPNDGLMALINAYIAYKYDITNGFKDMKRAYVDYSLEAKPASVIGVYAPTFRTVN